MIIKSEFEDWTEKIYKLALENGNYFFVMSTKGKAILSKHMTYYWTDRYGEYQKQNKSSNDILSDCYKQDEEIDLYDKVYVNRQVDVTNTLMEFCHDITFSDVDFIVKGKDGIQNLIDERGKEHVHEIERVFWFGKENSDQLITCRQYPKGFFNFNIQRQYASFASFDKDDLSNFFLNKMIHCNPHKEMTGWCNLAFKNFLYDLMKNESPGPISLVRESKQNTYGINVDRLNTIICNINLIDNYTLNEYFDKTAVLVICDMDKIRSCYLSVNDYTTSTKLLLDTQFTSPIVHHNTIYSLCGLQIDEEEYHSVLILT